ncbi:hypothetical protein THOM_0411 [Trachipleistophora hominis]|uniref:Uncharacterized protein n=1 Tax=Trachipleistophora hominis TaxID=72359 RepID=L7JZG7_TRAHO|nr:hypothetical protein THOM_0411 [Trachipleistophora hominis]
MKNKDILFSACCRCPNDENIAMYIPEKNWAMILWILHPFMVYRMKIWNAIDIKGYTTTDIYADMSCTKLINDLECVRMNRSYKNQRDGAEYYQMNILQQVSN